MKLLLIAVLTGATPFATSAVAEDHTPSADEVQVAELSVTGAFIRATLPHAPVAGGYMTIANHGITDDRLLSVTAPIGERTDIHEMTIENDVMTMRALPDGLPVPAGETVSLQPAGNHLMIMGLSAQLVEGQSYDLTLKFENVGEVTVPFDVLALNARKHPGLQETDTHAPE
ncbi:copper chaperone PCu(A)C [Celeribacter halophilus]|uniref:Copper(I)-binding protein n=1 Tax=Celeribacter halophilus TaxID=576117 RepID=A0A1I3T436_9RHOB|nr:copper chaperone PCu(A)C [Celeribacter halophilus]PZX11959.1 hypothetical protein LX82_01503 [Celeribacter halophilus]SFJ64959.1 hypothetical protein SAMN04488138_107213 [Celeribacter halophilus]